MSLNSKFLEIWKSSVTIVKTFFTIFIFFIIEQLMELEFKCPSDKTWTVWYSLAYFIIPALTWFSLSFFFERNSFLLCRRFNWSDCCSCAIWKTVVPPIAWIIILLIDGRYLDCLVGHVKNDGSNTNSSDSTAYLISQMLGMLVFFICLLMYLLTQYYPVWHCNYPRFKKEGRDYEEIEKENKLFEEGKNQILEIMEERNKEKAKANLDESELLKKDDKLENIFLQLKSIVINQFKKNENTPMEFTVSYDSGLYTNT